MPSNRAGRIMGLLLPRWPPGRLAPPHARTRETSGLRRCFVPQAEHFLAPPHGSGLRPPRRLGLLVLVLAVGAVPVVALRASPAAVTFGRSGRRGFCLDQASRTWSDSVNEPSRVIDIPGGP